MVVKVEDTEQSENGTTVTCGLCEKDFPYKKFLGAFVIDHSYDGNTYLPFMICKRCWWINTDLQDKFTGLINEYVHKVRRSK